MPLEMPPEGSYCVLSFTHEVSEQEEEFYQIRYNGSDVVPVSENIPWDSYVLEESLPQIADLSFDEVESVSAYAAEPAVAASFVYVGEGKGMYKLTRMRTMENIAAMTGTMPQDTGIQEENEESGAGDGLQTVNAAELKFVSAESEAEVQPASTESEEEVQPVNAESGEEVQPVSTESAAEAQSVIARAAVSGFPYYVEVRNAPVYIRCTGGKDYLRKYVFNSLSKQDNDKKDFAITVNTKLACEVNYKDVEDADLIYLEDGSGLYLNQSANKLYIPKKGDGVTPNGVPDIEDKAVIAKLVEDAVQSLKPVIVDYGAIENKENSVGANYKGSNYQLLAKAFLKKDLLAFYNDMAKDGNLADNILMNLVDDKELKDHPDKEDNDYNYVNRNVYIVNSTPLVGDDFADAFEEVEAKAGFGEVLAAIRAENTVQSGDDKLSEKVSKAMAVQYIINYSLGLVGEYKDLSILELQPTANPKSDLWQESNGKGGVVLFWQRQKEDQKGTTGQQILRSSKEIKINQTMRSVVAFNTDHEDINETYNMIFIGLDGQRFYREWNDDGKLVPVFNDNDNLKGKAYHTGDRVPDSDARYDANDITEQKKKELLDYLRAGYPIVVENECFKEKSAQKAGVDEINKDVIGDDTNMYAFLRDAVNMIGAGENGENGIGLYTIEDVHSSALFNIQLNAQRPKVELRKADNNTGEDNNDSEENKEDDSQQEETVSDRIETEPVPEKPGILRGTIGYRITSDRTGDDKNYQGSLSKHLYLDLNYDGVFAPEEEFTGYQVEESDGNGTISVDFNEIDFGIVPWKLEVRDDKNEFRRASVQGCFTLRGSSGAKIRVLQILDDTENQDANFQKQFEDIENSTLAHFLIGAEGLLNMKWDIETVVPTAPDDKDSLEKRLSENKNYLSQWDVIVLGFGDGGSPGDTVMNAVDAYIKAGGSVLVSSAGSSADKGRVGLSAEVLGQKNDQTYGKLSIGKGEKVRYEGMKTDMFKETASLWIDRANDGTIAKWPYEINERVELTNITKLSAPDYLLDIGTVRKENEDKGKAYTTAWFTLSDQEVTDNRSAGGYSVSPYDGRNNYYVYSKGNVVYVGQSVYPYYYEEGKEIPEEKDGIYECRIFVNALMAAYNAGVHRGGVSIVAGFNGKNKVESVTVPFDVTFKESKTDGDKGGILGETVDVYFRFTDNNIAVDKVTMPTFYYRNSGVPAEAELLNGNTINTTDFTAFPSSVWAVENNRLVEVDVTNGIVPGKVYRIKAPLTVLQTEDDVTSQISVLLTSEYTRAEEKVTVLSTDNVSLNRAQMFLLE